MFKILLKNCSFLTFVLTIFMMISSINITFAQTGELRRTSQSVRNLGMGNTGIALGYDENAMYYNPAGLAGVDTILVGFPFLFEISQETVSIFTDVSKLSGDSKTADTVALLMGKNVHFRSLSNFNMVMPFGDTITFGLASGVETQFDMGVRNPVAIEMKAGFRLDRISSFGFAMPILKKRYLIGASVDSISRCDIPMTTLTIGTILSGTSISDSFGSCSLTSLSKAQTYNFGFQKRLEMASSLKMTWGMVVRNYGGLKFNRAAGVSNPADQYEEYSTGISMQPSWGPIRMLYSIDIRDWNMKHADDTYCRSRKGTDCTWKRLHMGTEWGFFPIDSGANGISLRAGFNQGYFTYGFELNPFIFFRALNIQYAVYKVETGDQIGDSPDQRKVIQINLGF